VIARVPRDLGELALDDRPAIETRGLTRTFGAISALDAVDLTVARGESVAVFGPNGAGKTTLLKILSLALRPSSGSFHLAGRDPRAEDRAIRRITGMISHRTFLYDELSGRENLLLFARLYGVTDARARVEQLLDEVGLASRADDPSKTYSRGMQQRLSLARCLIHDPEIVLLDEPFSGLDPHAARGLRDTLARLRREGRTLLLVTHNFDEGLELSDRWVVLHRGRIVDRGSTTGLDRHAFEDAYQSRLGAAARPRGILA
jgi:heme exporter protein A